MIDWEKPPLSKVIYEQIAQSWHKIDLEYWPKIASFRMPIFTPRTEPVAPQSPQLLLLKIREYATQLFKVEADEYKTVSSDHQYRHWLSKLEARVLSHVLKTFDTVDDAKPKERLTGHGLERPSMTESLRELLWELANGYAWKASQPAATPSAPQRSEVPKTEQSRRMSATIHSPSAAGKMEAYMASKGLGQTEFAIQAQTTDKTIRKFRQTGKVKRSILDGIASAMGISKEELLK